MGRGQNSSGAARVHRVVHRPTEFDNPTNPYPWNENTPSRDWENFRLGDHSKFSSREIELIQNAGFVTNYRRARQYLSALCEQIAEICDFKTIVEAGLAVKAVEFFAHVIKDDDLEREASAVRCMTRIRLGEAIIEAQKRGELYSQGGDRKSNCHDGSLTKTLSDLGISWRVSAACKHLAGLTRDQQEKLLAGIRLGTQSVNSTLHEIRLRESKHKRFAGIVHEATLDPRAPAFPLIYADPPWDMGANQIRWPNKPHASAAAHYITIPEVKLKTFLDDKKIKVCADAVLFLWAIVPLLDQAFRIMEAWGFAYKHLVVWDKEIPNCFGRWLPSRIEVLLIGTRGKMPPIDNMRPKQVGTNLVRIRKGKHSAKPHEFYDLIDRWYPKLKTAPRLEIFARNKRPGWWSFGNEVGSQGPPLNGAQGRECEGDNDSF